MYALIVQTIVISNQVIIIKQLTYVFNSTRAFAYATQRSLDSDHQQTIFTYLLKTTWLFCGVIKPVTRNWDKEEKDNFQKVPVCYHIIYLHIPKMCVTIMQA